MIKVTRTPSQLCLAIPFNWDFVDRAKRLGGRWDRERRVWAFPLRREEEVAALCRDIYREDITSERGPGLVVRITAKRDLVSRGGCITFSGIIVAQLNEWDPAPWIASGCGLVRGRLETVVSGGDGSDEPIRAAMIAMGSVVEVENVAPEAASETADWSVETVGEHRPSVEAAELRAERARLLARVALIDALLAPRSMD